MADYKNSGKVTIANIIAIVGLALLMAFTYIGHSFQSGGEMGWDIVVSVGITAFTGFLLWFLVKAKGAENELDKWRKIEYATLAVYVLFAIPASFMGGIMHFFAVNDNKATIKEYAQADVNKINQMISAYKEFESAAITNTGNGLRGLASSNQRGDEKLMDFMEKNEIKQNSQGAEIFEDIQRNNLLGAAFETYYQDIMKREEEFLNAVNGWSIIQIPLKAKMMVEMAVKVEEELTRRSEAALLPRIEDKGGIWSITEYNQCREFRINGGIENFQFMEALQNTKGFSLTALFVVLLIHLLIIFNYIVAHRTNVIRGGKEEKDGGIILN